MGVVEAGVELGLAYAGVGMVDYPCFVEDDRNKGRTGYSEEHTALDNLRWELQQIYSLKCGFPRLNSCSPCFTCTIINIK